MSTQADQLRKIASWLRREGYAIPDVSRAAIHHAADMVEFFGTIPAPPDKSAPEVEKLIRHVAECVDKVVADTEAIKRELQIEL